MAIRLGVALILITAAGCTGKDSDSLTGASSEASVVNAEVLCDAYLKGDERFTGKAVTVRGYLIGYGYSVEGEERDVTLGTDRNGNSRKWVRLKVTAQEFAHIPTRQWGEIIKVKGTCVGASKKGDSILVQMRECRFIRPVAEKLQP